MSTLINTAIIEDVRSIIARSKNAAIRAVDNQRVRMYWEIGRTIFEEEQRGQERASYGEYLIKYLSERLQPEFGSGFSRRQLELFRQLYRVFPIANAVRSQLSWTHYRHLIRIDNQYKRDFYIAESVKNNWTARQMERQINSQLFERLLLSNDKESVLAQVKKGMEKF